jgi:hypothetical protein
VSVFLFPYKSWCRVIIAYRLVGKPEGKRPLRRPRRRWFDNIRIDLVEVGWGAWTGFVWLRIGTGGEPL